MGSFGFQQEKGITHKLSCISFSSSIDRMIKWVRDLQRFRVRHKLYSFYKNSRKENSPYAKKSLTQAVFIVHRVCITLVSQIQESYARGSKFGFMLEQIPDDTGYQLRATCRTLSF